VPTVHREGPYRFFFYSNEGSERPHVHVQRDSKVAKFWLDPAAAASSGSFSPSELREIRRIVEEHQIEFSKAWHEFFNR